VKNDNNWQEKERTEITKNIYLHSNEESQMKLEQKREEEERRKMSEYKALSFLSINTTRIFKERTYRSIITSECTRCECSRSTITNQHSTSLLF
jgi:hypothetical protein